MQPLLTDAEAREAFLLANFTQVINLLESIADEANKAGVIDTQLLNMIKLNRTMVEMVLGLEVPRDE